MVTKVIRRAARPEREDEPVAAPAAPKRGWLNLRAEVVGEMRALGVNPSGADVGNVRGEWRSET